MRITAILIGIFIWSNQSQAQTVSFNFSAASQPVSGWINVTGDPSLTVRTATDPATGITISSVATANWSQFNSISSYDGLGAAGGSFFPAAVMLNHWFNYDGTLANYQPGKPQFQLTGLNKNAVYTIRMAGSTTSSLNANPSRYTVAGSVVYAYLDANNHNNTLNGATFNNVSPDSTGTIKVYVNTITGTDVADISGLQISLAPAIGLTAGEGLAQNAAGALSLGDSVTGSGPHNFNSNRYQFLNGHTYSIGGSVNDPVTRPVFRVYDNGDLAIGATMDTSVHSVTQSGLLYYSKLGILQIGSGDKLDTTVSRFANSNTQSSGIILNSIAFPNHIKGHLYDAYIAGSGNTIDTNQLVQQSIILGSNYHFTRTVASSLLLGGNSSLPNGPILTSIINGYNDTSSKGILTTIVSGQNNFAVDDAVSCLVSGNGNKYGGSSQFVAGNQLINRSPYAAVVGNGNVDFTSLPLSNDAGFSPPVPPIIAKYPVFAVGNSSNPFTARANALTILYSGRTQINATGFGTGMTEADVTPKAALEVVSTNSGVLLPKLTNTQRNAIAAGDLQNGLLLYNTDSSSFQFYNGSAWTSVSVGGGASSHWQLSAANIYDSLDNIGIGTSNTQGYKLAVNGNAIFTSVKVKPRSGWPDYVFKKNYQLPALKDLEQYITTHQHLPGLPSAGEVNKEGQDLGVNQTALLKKVEELTLYVIELNKKVEQLSKENARMKKGMPIINGHKTK